MTNSLLLCSLPTTYRHAFSDLLLRRWHGNRFLIAQRVECVGGSQKEWTHKNAKEATTWATLLLVVRFKADSSYIATGFCFLMRPVLCRGYSKFW